MASIVLSTVATVVGAATGMPFTGQVAGLLASGVGKGSKREQSYEGARLENLAVQTSTYGRMIPLVFGTVRISGNVIWSRPIREIASTTTTEVRSGGKGGGGGGGGSSTSTTTSTTYSYYVTLAIAICEGEITRLERVWADSKLLDLSQGVYRIYKGGETQLPDPLIESFQGVGATPAYRGMAYVVIEDFPLADFGNRIPNFTFEVTRRVTQEDSASGNVESMVKAISLIPGSGEFVYDTQTQLKYNGNDFGGGFVQSGYQISLNRHTPEGKANSLVALDQLEETFPNLEWVSVVVNWFGTSMDIASCEIWPGVEYQSGAITTPEVWSVAGLNRATARQIGYDGPQIRYGGTPDDESLIRLLTELRARGLKILLYPMMLMDVAGKPWRGEVTGAAANVANFFTRTRGYNAFITHYANLAAGRVDAFAIGTEMRDLNKITSSAGVFPAVSQFVSLAATVKAIVGGSVKVTYAADWTEYHHTDGGWYHLDPLWASANIDMVGIDAYFPISDAVQTGYDIDGLREGWTSGEGYDWYYTDVARTTQASLAPAYAWKNLSWWWNNTHTNPVGAVMAWVPGSKPIWFTEYGFASVDGCANQPNVFVDATTSASAYPRFSRGRVDFMAQRAAIAATELEWAGSAMVVNKFLWTWDARPYPYWPDLRDVWADGGNWITGHWVQGKLGASHVSAVVRQLLLRAGLTEAQIDVANVQAVLDGFVIHERVSARAAIDQLMQTYFFTMKESAAKLVLVPRDASVDAVVNADQCVPRSIGGQEVAYTLERVEDALLPDRLEVQFLNRLQRYEANMQRATRNTQEATDTVTLRLSLVLSQTHARAVAEVTLANRWAERTRVTLQLPIAYAALEPADVAQLNDGTTAHRIRVNQVQLGRPGIVRISGVVDAAEAVDLYIPPVDGGSGGSVVPVPATRFELLDIPALPADAQDALTLRFAACGIAPGWTGATISREMGTGNDERLIRLTQAATIGTAVTVLGDGSAHLFDRVNTVDVSLLGDGMLTNATEAALLNGSNVAVIGDEVFQFATATLLSPGVYRLSTLLRGRLGTESAMAAHAIGERFVLLNEAVLLLVLSPNRQGQQWSLRASSNGQSLDAGTTANVTIQGNSLKPLSPVQLAAISVGGGDIGLSWIRRARIDGGLRDYVDIPLKEAIEQYEVSIYDGVMLKRRFRVNTPSATYTNAEQVADFGSAQTSVTFSVAQLSALVGLGNVASVTVAVG